MNTIFNVLDYGAIGDNHTDNTIAIQKAIDLASTCEGKVIIPPGRYLTKSLKLKGKGVTLEGSASWSYRGVGGSVLILCSDESDYLIDISGSFGCSIINLNLTTSITTNRIIHGIKLYWKNNNGGSEEDTPKIDGCKICNFSGDGIHLDHVWCFSIRHSMIAYNKGNGVFINGWDGFNNIYD